MEYEQKYLSWIDNVALRTYRILNESLSSSHEIPHCEFLVRKTRENSNNMGFCFCFPTVTRR